MAQVFHSLALFRALRCLNKGTVLVTTSFVRCCTHSCSEHTHFIQVCLYAHVYRTKYTTMKRNVFEVLKRPATHAERNILLTSVSCVVETHLSFLTGVLWVHKNLADLLLFNCRDVTISDEYHYKGRDFRCAIIRQTNKEVGFAHIFYLSSWCLLAIKSPELMNWTVVSTLFWPHASFANLNWPQLSSYYPTRRAVHAGSPLVNHVAYLYRQHNYVDMFRLAGSLLLSYFLNGRVASLLNANSDPFTDRGPLSSWRNNRNITIIPINEVTY